MDRKQIYIDVLIHKGIYKEENTGRQLYEMDEKELFGLIKRRVWMDGNEGISR
ncbi:Fur-regulated basic protein FbpA [Bacillus thuringiensis]|uniref:Fur-regulated basic protein FbpA n=1 Tax=Bacillus thuringiensis TaxID=1428 RepID=UPI000BF7B3C0|nr:Fur-regulated basic protein FbpA [Bacillus thuringiensis]PFW04142.1 Fur-regulated basic protein FbpA [Bacillus thuringiensis]